MSKRRQRSKDPHSWIKDTTKKVVERGPAESPDESATAGEGAEGEEASESAPQRHVIVEYDSSDGTILALHEILPGAQEEGAGEVPAGAPGDRAAAVIALTGKLVNKTLLDLHDNHKVVVSKKRPSLVPKG